MLPRFSSIKPNVVPTGITTWARPPQGQAMDDGTMPGDPNYVDPHAEAMATWNNIDKGPTGGFRPDGTAIMHSDPDSAHSLSLLSEDSGSGSGSGEGGYGKKRVGEQSRKQMNLTGRHKSTILTSIS